ncbi:glutathione s-transferase [Stagonosporopsis vannaccii]|nr:glutathione s-transferase [Stagonosporopsis vannaccii]
MDLKTEQRIAIYRGADLPSQYTWSPFVSKLELRCRLSGLKYICDIGFPPSGPKGKIPYVELTLPGQTSVWLSDSTLIAKDFVKKGLLRDLNAHLSVLDKGHDLAIRALMEDKLAFYDTHERWVKNYYVMRDHAMGKLPYPARVIAGTLAYRGIVQRLHEQGTGRFNDAEIIAFTTEVWQAVNGLLESSLEKQEEKDECFWVLGCNQPSEADTSVFGFVVANLVSDSAPWSRNLLMKEFPTTVEYAKRIHMRYFPDYQMWD